MDYAYSPIQTIDINQRIIIPLKKHKTFKGKRSIRVDLDYDKIVRIKQRFVYKNLYLTKDK